MEKILAPSILAADIMRLGEQIEAVKNAGAHNSEIFQTDIPRHPAAASSRKKILSAGPLPRCTKTSLPQFRIKSAQNIFFCFQSVFPHIFLIVLKIPCFL